MKNIDRATDAELVSKLNNFIHSNSKYYNVMIISTQYPFLQKSVLRFLGNFFSCKKIGSLRFEYTLIIENMESGEEYL